MSNKDNKSVIDYYKYTCKEVKYINQITES